MRTFLMSAAVVLTLLGCSGKGTAELVPAAPRNDLMAAMPVTRPASDFTWVENAIVRGSRDEKVIALMFTGGSWGDGTMDILDTLEERGILGSFYFTGEFLANPENQAALRRMIATGHTVGAHGHGHLLYAPWEDRSQTLVTQEDFTEDLLLNMAALEALGVSRERSIWWVAPYEWYNRQHVEWSLAIGMRLFNFSPGTVSHTDYTESDAPNFRTNDTIYRSIVDFEANQPDGLNGFVLFTHVGSSPKRLEKFHTRLPELLDHLLAKGYRFVLVEDLLEGAPLLPE
ncbi:MAG: polysaccharide deacetylase family protein [Candidatus Sumerlaeia bacterium]|nr:polysaccharide deacetylase family protein [Candidatus Sumerlaeia bacterium]